MREPYLCVHWLKLLFFVKMQMFLFENTNCFQCIKTNIILDLRKSIDVERILRTI